MKKLAILFLLAGSFSMTANTIEVKNDATLEKVTKVNTAVSNDDDCRVCCTISSADAYGNITGITACSGNLFTSCETAGRDACLKVAQKALDIMKDLN